jgi:transposase
MDSEGFMRLWKAIAEHSKDLAEVSAAVESTACYHINLYSFLTAKGISTVVINPLLIANFAKLSLRKTKTDKKDAMSIAQFLLVHGESISHLSLSQDLQDFRDIARERESVATCSVPIRSRSKDCFRVPSQNLSESAISQPE